MQINIGDKMWHPCSMDIIEHEVIGIRHYETITLYELRSTKKVGASGRIEILVNKYLDKFTFVQLIDEDLIEYARGLQDFIEGNYYLSYNEARLEFINKQRLLALSNMEEKKRLFNAANERYKQVCLLIETIKEEL